MLTINGRKYAKNDREAVESVFGTGGTVDGFYKVNKRRKHYGGTIILSDLQNKPFAAVVCHDGFRGIVNASRDERGMFYQYGLSDDRADTLGVSGVRYIDRPEYAESIWNAATA